MVRVVQVAVLLCLLSGCGGFYVMHGTNEDRRTALERASMNGDAAEVKRLLATGADANERSGIYGSPLNAAAGRQGNAEVLRLLLAAGANPNGRGKEGQGCWAPPLFTAAGSHDLENTRTLLEAGASVGNTPCFTLSPAWLTPPVLDLLEQYGLNLQELDAQGRNALHLALLPPGVPAPETVEYLLRAGVPLSAQDHAARTPLDYWKQPRDFEARWFTTWLIERLDNEDFFRRQRENRKKITALLGLAFPARQRP
jgi:ankyrin repeat protein